GGGNIAGNTAASNQWGEQVRVPVQNTLTTPGGRSVTRSLDARATGLTSTAVGAVANPLDFDTYETTSQIAGVQYRQAFDRASQVLTNTSPEGRVTTIAFNDNGLPERFQVLGFGDTVLTYDDLGRIERVTQAADGETRVMRYAYGAD